MIADERDRAAAEGIGEPLAELAAQTTLHLVGDRLCQLHGNGVAHLVVLAGPVAVEDETVGEALQACRLADRDGAVLLWVGVFTGFGITEPCDDRPGHAVPGHTPVPAGVILPQRPLHA